MNNILEYLEKTAASGQSNAGVDDGCVSMSWQEVKETAKTIGTVFAEKTISGRPIVVLMEKSAAALEGMFGSVYAGCFYTFLDPRLPAARVREIFTVLAPAVVLTDQEHVKLLDQISFTGRVLFFEECLRAEIDEEKLEGIRRRSRDSDILYCMFTSGSTGKPKGITVSHRAVIDFITHFVEEFHITGDERIGNQAPFDFDVSVKDIYASVFTGASLILIPQKMFLTPPLLLDYLCEKRISTLIWAVSALTLISSLNGLQYRVPSDIKRVMFSGEVMPLKQLQLWQSALPEAEFVNLYGPTEITCNCTFYRVTEPSEKYTKLPIGKAFPGREVFLQDSQGQLITEMETTGEICVSGESLSEGYYHDGDETNRRFGKKENGERYYRTGDLGYIGRDGELYFSGRKDFQVKVMGRRIELEEVEGAINQLDGVVNSCCVVDRMHSRILAYYCGEGDARQLRAQLQGRLPAYMIPQKMIRMGQFPLNKNGKIDRQRLEALLEKGPDRRNGD